MRYYLSRPTGVDYRYVMRTYYDRLPAFTLPPAMAGQVLENIHNRIAFTTLHPVDNINVTTYHSALFYSYDIMGNVKKLYTYNNLAPTDDEAVKTVDYNYDLQSGKVNKVYYQKDKKDQFIHKYSYDAENRLTDVHTSFDDRAFNREARYTYYLHGPLARTEMGERKVQGLDYVYTLQGWLKSVNGSTISNTTEPGQDGIPDLFSGTLCATAPNPNESNAQPKYKGVARDAVAFSLDYNQNDYQSITGSNGNIAAQLSGKNLYNGNIVSMKVTNKRLENTGLNQPATMGFSYTYDQLHRLVAMDAFKGSTNTPTEDYKERISYDANGNILTYQRNKDNAPPAPPIQSPPLPPNPANLDDLTYKYYFINSAGQKVTGTPTPQDKLTNQLAQVKDALGLPVLGPGKDIGNQGLSNNYVYDALGNLIEDKEEGVTISWTPTGKIAQIGINKSPNPAKSLIFDYSPLGQRIMKRLTEQNGTTYTYYSRDASGNIMATYKSFWAIGSNAEPSYELSEYPVYGSSRLGVKNPKRFSFLQQSQQLWPPSDNQQIYPDDYFNVPSVTFEPTTSTVTGSNYDEEEYQEAGYNYSYLAGVSPYVFKTKARLVRQSSGMTQYEIPNHLGNVLATLKDEILYTKTCTGSGSNQCCVLERDPIVLSATDYYPFGMPMPNRTYSLSKYCRTISTSYTAYKINDDFASALSGDWSSLNNGGTLSLDNQALRIDNPAYSSPVISKPYTLAASAVYTLNFDVNSISCGTLSTSGVYILYELVNSSNIVILSGTATGNMRGLQFTSTTAGSYTLRYTLMNASGAPLNCSLSLDNISFDRRVFIDLGTAITGWTGFAFTATNTSATPVPTIAVATNIGTTGNSALSITKSLTAPAVSTIGARKTLTGLVASKSYTLNAKIFNGSCAVGNTITLRVKTTAAATAALASTVLTTSAASPASVSLNFTAGTTGLTTYVVELERTPATATTCNNFILDDVELIELNNVVDNFTTVNNVSGYTATGANLTAPTGALVVTMPSPVVVSKVFNSLTAQMHYLNFDLIGGSCAPLSLTSRYIRYEVLSSTNAVIASGNVITSAKDIPVSITVAGNYTLRFALVNANGSAINCDWSIDNVQLDRRVSIDLGTAITGWTGFAFTATNTSATPVPTIAVATNIGTTGNSALSITKSLTAPAVSTSGARKTLTGLVASKSYTLNAKIFNGSCAVGNTITLRVKTSAAATTTLASTVLTTSAASPAAISLNFTTGTTGLTTYVVELERTPATATTCNNFIIDDIELVQKAITLDDFGTSGNLSSFTATGATLTNTTPVGALKVSTSAPGMADGVQRTLALDANTAYTYSYSFDKGTMTPSATDYVRMELMQGSSVLYTRNIMATETFSFNYTPTTTGNYTWKFRRIVSSLSALSTYFKLDNISVAFTAQATTSVCDGGYRFGFNTQEKDDEVYGEGNLMSAEYWEYDARIGRRWNVDPILRTWESPYVTFCNNPINLSDINGDNPGDPGDPNCTELLKNDDGSDQYEVPKDAMRKKLPDTDVKGCRKPKTPSPTPAPSKSSEGFWSKLGNIIKKGFNDIGEFLNTGVKNWGAKIDNGKNLGEFMIFGTAKEIGEDIDLSVVPDGGGGTPDKIIGYTFEWINAGTDAMDKAQGAQEAWPNSNFKQFITKDYYSKLGAQIKKTTSEDLNHKTQEATNQTMGVPKPKKWIPDTSCDNHPEAGNLNGKLDQHLKNEHKDGNSKLNLGHME